MPRLSWIDICVKLVHPYVLITTITVLLFPCSLAIVCSLQRLRQIFFPFPLNLKRFSLLETCREKLLIGNLSFHSPKISLDKKALLQSLIFTYPSILRKVQGCNSVYFCIWGFHRGVSHTESVQSVWSLSWNFFQNPFYSFYHNISTWAEMSEWSHSPASMVQCSALPACQLLPDIQGPSHLVLQSIRRNTRDCQLVC